MEKSNIKSFPKKSSEEKKIIVPSIIKLRKKGIKVKGPLISDTLFINDFKNFEF